VSPGSRRDRVLLVGLTGGIACGKTEVSRELQRLGCLVIDADQIARDVVEPGQPGWEKVVDRFGRSILLADDRIDRRALGRIVFADPSARDALNRILHPLIIEAERGRVRALVDGGHAGIIVTEAALMIEAGIHTGYDRLIVVHCSPAIQLARLMGRDRLDAAEAQKRIDAQMPLVEKMKLASDLIDTAGTLEESRRQVQALHRLLLQELARRAAPPAPTELE